MELVEKAKKEGRCAAIWPAAVLRRNATGQELIHPHWIEPDKQVLINRTVSPPGGGFGIARRTRVAVIELPMEGEGEKC